MTEYDAALPEHPMRERGRKENIAPGKTEQPSGPRFSGRSFLLLLPLLLIAAVMAFAIWQPIKVLPRISLAPGYALTDQAGDSFNSEALRGKITLYTFTHSQCAAPCVPTSATLAQIERALASVPTGNIPLHFVALYVDEDQATPATLQAEAQRLGVDPERWHLLTGAPEQMKQVIGSGFSTYYGPMTSDGGNTTLEVDPVFVLVDGWGIIRAFYRTANPDIEILQRDLSLIVEEARQSSGVTRYAYEAAHLFLCYPK